MTSRAKFFGRLIFWPIFLLSVWFVLGHSTQIRYGIKDWWRLQSYQPTEFFASLATETTLTSRGRDIFYASLPGLNDKQVFNQNCNFKEQAFVIGCYDGDRIYLLDITLPEIEAAEPVTAAHEMLHGAWVRLSPDEQRDLGEQLRQVLATTTDTHLAEIIQRYRDAGTNETDITNELHSIVPTEVHDIPPALEKYYSRYFSDRQQIVSLYDSYEAVFEANENELTSLKQQIDDDYTRLQAEASALDSKKAAIEASERRLQALSDQGETSQYNSLVPQHNALVRSYNADIARYNSHVASYRAAVARYNELATYQIDLTNALNSRSEL